MKAVVVGATGAIGEQLVGQLLTSPKWSSVVAIGRRPVTVPEEYKDTRGALKQVQVSNLDNIKSEAGDEFNGADAVFCALGTTRKAAGSADAFIKVDLDYVKLTAEAAKAGGAKHFSLVSAAGANANVPFAYKAAPFHAFLYTSCKGKAEEFVKAQGFPSTAIFRPGMLNRGDHMRPLEKSFLWVGSIKVSDVAQLMVRAAEAASSAPTVAVYEMSEMQKAVKEGRPCKVST